MNIAVKRISVRCKGDKGKGPPLLFLVSILLEQLNST